MTNLRLNGKLIYRVDEIADNYNEAELVKAFKTGDLAKWLDQKSEKDILQSVGEIDEKSKNLASELIKALGLVPQLCSKAEKKAKAEQGAIAKRKEEARKAKEEEERKAKEEKEAIAKRKKEEEARKVIEENMRKSKAVIEAIEKRRKEERKAMEEAARKAQEEAEKAEAENARRRRENERAARAKKAKDKRAKEKRIEKLAGMNLDELLERLNSARTKKAWQEIKEVYIWRYRNASSWERAKHKLKNGQWGDALGEIF